MTTTQQTTPEHDRAATQLIAMKERAYAMHHDNAQRARDRTLTGQDLEAVLELEAQIKRECESFRRTFYPRRHRIITANGCVFTVSASGNRTQLVYIEQEAGR